LVRQKNIII